MQQEQPIIVGLDIGTTKIAAIAGRKNEFGKLEILGFGRANSNGVQHGMVLNIDQTIKAIQIALEKCMESNPSLDINEVYVGIAGHHIKSLQTRGDIVRQNIEDEISQEEIDRLIADQYRTYIPLGDQIIDVIPQQFTVDNHPNIANPIGYSGVKVGANFHIITGDKNAIRNINRSVEKSGLRTKDLVLQPLASAAAVMSEQDLEAGVAIVDIGGGTTEIAVIALGGIVCDKSVKIAGDVFTNDIVYYMRTQHNLFVGEATAEKIKIEIGAAIEDLETPPDDMSVQGRDLLTGKPKQVEVSYREIAKALDKSIQRIEDAVMETLSQTPPELAADIYNTGIYLAGGGSMLRGLDKRISQKTDLPVYIAEDPLRAVVRGTGMALKNIPKFRSILIK